MTDKVDTVNQKPTFMENVRQRGFIGVGAFLGGYYGLGVLYVHGYMDVITPLVRNIATPILLYFGVGYAGIGLALQQVDWYTTIAIRLICASIAGAICLAIQKVFIRFFNFLNDHKPAFLKPRVSKSSKVKGVGRKFPTFLR